MVIVMVDGGGPFGGIERHVKRSQRLTKSDRSVTVTIVRWPQVSEPGVNTNIHR